MGSTPATATASVGGTERTVCKDAARLTASVSETTAGKEYTVILVQGTGAPTASSTILFMDQKQATGDSISFDVYPSALSRSDMTLWVTSNDAGAARSASLGYYAASAPARTFLPGDVDGDGGVTAADAIIVLRASVGLTTLGAEGFSAADVDGNGVVNAADAARILRMSAGLAF